MRRALDDQRFHGGKPIGPTLRDANAAHENPGKRRIDQFEIKRIIRDRMHRQSQDQMRANAVNRTTMKCRSPTA